MASEGSCDTTDGLRSSPTSCEFTAYCATGTCYDSQEGICEEGVSQTVCQNAGGVWSKQKAEELSQCQLGCCTLGDEAAFVTQSRCKELSSLYGLKTAFDISIGTELECIASAGGDAKGACVYSTETSRTCQMLSKSACNVLNANDVYSGVEFYEGILCSNENLGTDCGPKDETTCVEGENEVYFVDTCGNLANIYDAERYTYKLYWAEIIEKEDSCGYEENNANSKTCGNCNYYAGSVCGSATSTATNPKYGDRICRDLGCDYEGQHYAHGESWCGGTATTNIITDPNQNGTYFFDGEATKNNAETNLPGSSYQKLTCYNGEVSVENCYDERQKVCVESEINGVTNAVCKLNTWQDCYDQTNKSDCLDREARDCDWVEGKDTEALGVQETEHKEKGYCVPTFTPGFDFWNGTGNGDAICSLGTISCEYEITDKLLRSEKVKKGSECIDENGKIKQVWINAMNERCMALGDCGEKTNYLKYEGEKQTLYEKIVTSKK